MRTIQHAHGATDSKHFAPLSVALCLALAASGVALIALRTHRDHASDTLLASDAPAQQRLRDGWRELGTLASSFPPVIAATTPTTPEPSPEQGPSPSGSLSRQGTSDGLGGNGGNGGADNVAGGGMGGNAAPPRPSDRTQPAVSAAVPPAAKSNFSSQSALCGPSTCNLGQVCCNASCGTCTAPGATCDQKRCDNAIQYPASQACGLTTCNIDSVCCNPSCGICTAPGDECSQRACG